MARPRIIHRVRVGYIDTDAAQVVHHATYLRWFEQARIEFLRAVGWDYAAWTQREGLGLPVAENTVKYRAPAYFDDLLEVETWVSHGRRASITFEYAIRRDGKVLTVGHTKCACTTLKGEIRRVPDGMLRAVLADDYDAGRV